MMPAIPLRRILVASLALNVLGVWWGLPGKWVPIELLPEYVMGGLQQHFSHGWFDAYPPLHYFVLTVAMSPFMAVSWCCGISLDDSYTRMVLVNRLVSVAAGAGIVAATCAAGEQAFGRRSGLWAAGIMALTTPFVYYAKTANVDVPYLFWFSLSLVYYVRVLKGGPLRDYVLFATYATCSVCTKDQAYGLYVLAPIPIVVEIWRTNRRDRQPRALLRAATDRRVWIAAAISVVLFAAIQNLIFDWDGFMSHVQFITGGGSANFRVFEPTFAGRRQLFMLTLDLTEQALGWPFAVAVLSGLAIALATPNTRRTAVWLLVPVVSYYLTFIDVILYNYDRFMLPVCLVLALFGGLAFARLTTPRDRRVWALAGAAAVFVYTLLYAGAVDYLMIHDSRYEVDRWLQAHAAPPDVMGTTGQREYIPNLVGLNHADIPDLDTLSRVHPAYMLFNVDYGRAVPRDSDWGKMMQQLEHGTAGYTLVARFREPLPWAWLPGMHRDLTGPRRERIVFTTVRNINPTIEVFAADRK
jgi:4-amino-4-deoxy-L-arabinose transferase-like glycosyltransferase